MQQAVTSNRCVGVEVRGLVKRFGTATAVNDVSLDVKPGEFLALLGPSGSGKTTVLMTIAGFEYPDAGQILVGGGDVTWLPPNKRDLGMVFQKYTLFPHMSVLENIAFPLKMRGLGRAEREDRARAALRTVRLDTFGDRKPAQLSGGQQQRVAIARAIVYRPQVLLMDEPLSALDKNLREEMQIETKHLQREIGITVVFVTHDQTEALTMADRVAVLDHGRLQQIGSPEDLYEMPQTPFVAGFIGETNFCVGVAAHDAAAGSRLAMRIDGGAAIEGVAMQSVTAGAPVRLAVRPERLGFAGTGDAALTGRVTESIYAGNATSLVLATPTGLGLRMRLPAGRAEGMPQVGDVVGIGWTAEDARIFGDAP